MKNTSFQRAATPLALIALLVGTGCSSLNNQFDNALSKMSLGNSDAYIEGKSYLDAHAYDQAVQKFELALKDKPGNKKILSDLEKARSLAAQAHFKRGETLSAKDELSGALIAFEKAKTYQPHNQLFVNRYTQERKQYDLVKVKMTEVEKKARESNQWEQGITTLQSMTRYESSFPELHSRIQALQQQGAHYYETRSDDKLSQQDFEGSSEEIQQAAQLSNDTKFSKKNTARHHLLLSRQAWDTKKYSLAYEEILKGLEFEPDQPEFMQYQHQLVEQWVDVMYNEAIQAQNNGNPVLAKARLRRISQLKPGYLNVEALLADIGGGLNATYYTKADAFLQEDDRSKLGLALAHYLLVREQHDPQFADVEEKITMTKRMLLDDVQLRIAVHFGNKSSEPGAGGMVYNQILDRLRNSKKIKNLALIEREAIDKILQEQALGQGFLDPSTSPQVKKIKGAHAGLFGDVIRAKVQESGRDQPTFGSSTYVSGTQYIPNPDYAPRRQEVANAQQAFLMAKQDLGSAEIQSKQSQADLINRQQQMKQGLNSSSNKMMAIGNILQGLGSTADLSGARDRVRSAESRLQSAQTDLAITPETIEKEIEDTFRYPIYDLTLDGEVVLAYRLVNYTTAEVGASRTITKSGAKNDRYIQGDPGKGVPSDANDLPTKDEFLQGLLTEAIEGAAQAIESEMASYAESYYEKGLKAEEHGLEEDAIENYIRYIYSASNLGDINVQHANQYIYDKMGVLVIRRKT